MTLLNLDGYTDIPAGKLAAVVTHLEMRERPTPAVPTQAIRLRRVPQPDLGWYRALYAAIGLDWLWFSRLLMSDADLAAILHHPGVEVFAADGEREAVGIVELNRRDPADVEIAFFGLRADALGRGLGGAMMGEALRHAWQSETRRVWLHTCTLDHPGALGFYRRMGFSPFARAIEVIDDPRLSGRIPREAAPRAPII
ncbi:GNAT family N-acetyltransferase [Phreatobacter sp.]|uniref:GNAT family N-acetyltransferase n=1 Tax=Phreatobacter sp. TaxID=1966341 RepID=UPI003F6ED3D3